MYKIFIDTNIFLDFYRMNSKDKINHIFEELPNYQKYLIFTEQSKDEFLRNREKTISTFIADLNNQKWGIFENNFIATFDIYNDFKQKILEAKKATDKMIEACNVLKEDESKDFIYQLYQKLSKKNLYLRDDDIVEKAIRRKFIGNPPVSDKYTCCDEIIWETLLKYCNSNLIIVSNDKTFLENKKFLEQEYRLKKEKKLLIVNTISDALRLNGEIPSEDFENSEIDLSVTKQLEFYGCLQNESNWVSIIYQALIRLNGKALLQNIYSEVNVIIEEFYPEKLKNNNIKATIRDQIERYSSDSKKYNGKIDLFQKIDKGYWSIRKNI